jgi:hypothetical protein
MDHMRDFTRSRRGLAAAPALCLLLGACAAGAPATPPPPLVQGASRPGVAQPPARGVTPLVVRTATVSGDAATDVAGATCELSSPYTQGRFASPASVAVPDFGAATPPVTVTCVSGSLRGSAVAQPATRVADTGMSGWPAIGVSVGTGGGWGGGGGTAVSLGGFWNGGSGDGNWTQVVYPDLLVTLR